MATTTLPQVAVTGAFNPFKVRSARVTINVTRPNQQGVLTGFTYQFVDHRMRILVRDGGKQFGNAHVEIFGVPLATMNQVARLWTDALVPQNNDTITIDIWNGNGFLPFYSGVITWSAADASAMPEAKLVVEANAAFALMNLAAAPYANAGPVNLQAAITTIAAAAGYAVDWSASAPQYNETDIRADGSPHDQIAQLMNAHPDLTWFLNLQRIIVRKANAPFEADPIRIAADTGMMAFPVYSSSGLQFATIFNPRLRPGASLDVETQFDFVNRTVWVASVLSHQLDVNVPGGQWTTHVTANAYGPKGNAQS